MIALSQAETIGKGLNPSAEAYFPVLQHKIPFGGPKELLPPPHLKFLPGPVHFLQPPPPPQLYLSGKLLPPIPELRFPHHIVWAPVMTHSVYPHTAVAGSGKATAAMSVKNVPGYSDNQSVIFDSHPEKQRPACRSIPAVMRRELPPRLQTRASSSKLKFWRRKSGNLAPEPEKAEVADFPFGNSTTVMVRNIPNRLRQTELVRLLAEHCSEKNKSAPSKSEFDLVYLPVDFTRLGNKGYAFVNFTTVAGAAGLYHAWNHLGWQDFTTKKTRLITSAAIQGKENLKAHLERSLFECDTDAYLAVEFTPPCNGSNLSAIAASTVGSRVKAVVRGRMNAGVGRREN
ncbi:hypothetical protein V2J09_013888 [Rumex salicifolius]